MTRAPASKRDRRPSNQASRRGVALALALLESAKGEIDVKDALAEREQLRRAAAHEEQGELALPSRLEP